MKGRAEYENLEGEELFEGASALSLYPWVKRKGYGKGMIKADIGDGKTFVAFKIAEKIPSTIYMLNKETLEYEVKVNNSNPDIIFVDDVHYWLKATALSKIIGKERDEKEALEVLENFDKEAKEKDAKTIFISNDGPSGLHTYFSDENRGRFLKLFERCITSGDDTQIFLSYTSEFRHRSENVCCLREKISDKTAIKIREKFGMKEIPFIAPPYLLQEKHLDKDDQDFIFSVPQNEPETIMQMTSSENVYFWEIDKTSRKKRTTTEIWSPSNSNLWYLTVGSLRPHVLVCDDEEEKRIKRSKIPIPSEWGYNYLTLKSRHRFYGQKKISSIRELKVLSDNSDINAKNIDIVPYKVEPECVYYKLSQIRKISDNISHKYNSLMRKSMSSISLKLARILLYAKDESEARAILIDHDLRREQ